VVFDRRSVLSKSGVENPRTQNWMQSRRRVTSSTFVRNGEWDDTEGVSTKRGKRNNYSVLRTQPTASIDVLPHYEILEKGLPAQPASVSTLHLCRRRHLQRPRK